VLEYYLSIKCRYTEYNYSNLNHILTTIKNFMVLEGNYHKYKNRQYGSIPENCEVIQVISGMSCF